MKNLSDLPSYEQVGFKPLSKLDGKKTHFMVCTTDRPGILAMYAFSDVDDSRVVVLCDEQNMRQFLQAGLKALEQ